MATTTETEARVTVASWIPVSVARQLKREVEHRQATEIAALAGTKTTKPHGPVTVARFEC